MFSLFLNKIAIFAILGYQQVWQFWKKTQKLSSILLEHKIYIINIIKMHSKTRVKNGTHGCQFDVSYKSEFLINQQPVCPTPVPVLVRVRYKSGTSHVPVCPTPYPCHVQVLSCPSWTGCSIIRKN